MLGGCLQEALVLHIGYLIPIDLVPIQVNKSLRALIVGTCVASHQELPGRNGDGAPVEHLGQRLPVTRSSNLAQ
jgi:hypothetical protein